MAKDILGMALTDYLEGQTAGEIITYLRLPGFRDPISDTFPLDYLFRAYDNMPLLEQMALRLCRGKILDVGCGAGSHSLYLQEQGFAVTALDSSAGAISTCLKRGIKQTVFSTILEYTGTKFDTILLLMNGIGLAGSLGQLPGLLRHLKSLLEPNGQILADSSDIRYMYQQDENSIFQIPQREGYYGEGNFIMEYQGEKGSNFAWLYLDPGRMEHAARSVGLTFELVCKGPNNDFLARLS